MPNGDLREEKERAKISSALVSVGEKIRDLQTMLILAEEERWTLIEKGVSAGIRKAEIARLLGVSDGRVHQIIKTKEGKPKK